MAFGDKTHIGYTESGLIGLIATDLTAIRENKDTEIDEKINSELVKLENEITISKRQEAAISNLSNNITTAINNRVFKVGEMTPEEITAIKADPTQSFTSKINTLATFFKDAKSDLDGIGDTTVMVNDYNTTTEQQPLNRTRIDAIDLNVGELDTMKELYDKVMLVDVNDPTTVAGFEYSIKKKLDKKAKDGEQTKGNCLIYKDEVSKSFYELYISNGLIALEEVYNPDKDVISSYLNQQPFEYNLFTDYINSMSSYSKDTVKYFNRFVQLLPNTIVNVQAMLFTLASDQMICKIGYRLFSINDVTKNINLVEEYEENEFIVSIDPKHRQIIANVNVVKHGEACLVYISSGYAYLSDDPYNTGTIQYRSFNINMNAEPGNRIVHNNPTFSFNSTANNIASLGRLGYGTNNTSYYVLSEGDNKLKLFNNSGTVAYDILLQANTALLAASFNPAALYDTGNILMDNESLYVAVYSTDLSNDGGSYILKYNLADGSFINKIKVSNVRLNGLISFVGGQILFAQSASVTSSIIKFINKDLTIYTDTTANFGPFQFTNQQCTSVLYVKDLGNEKFIIKYNGIIKIYTYDGYEIYKHNTFLDMYVDVPFALDETLLLISQQVDTVSSYTTGNNGIFTLYSKPIYKYR